MKTLLAVAVALALSACVFDPSRNEYVLRKDPHQPEDYYIPAQQSGLARTGLTSQEIARNESKSVFCHDHPQVYEWVACKPSDDAGEGGD